MFEEIINGPFLFTLAGGIVPAEGVAIAPAPRLPFGRRLLRLAPVRRVLLGIYDRVFRWYYAD